MYEKSTKKGSLRKRMTSLRKRIFHSLQNIKLGRPADRKHVARLDRKHVARLAPPDPGPLLAPMVLGRHTSATERPGQGGQQGSNNYSLTPRQTSSDEDTDDEDYDDDEDDIEELNFNLMTDHVVYTRVVPQQTGREVEEEGRAANKTDQTNDASDESDDTDDDDESHVLGEEPAKPVVPIPAPRVSRLVQDQKEVRYKI
jgi:hypothetical protein